MRITLKQLTYFKALAEQQNFRRAAEVSHVSQPALSVQIQELERILGGALVERQPRRVILTPLGRDTLASATRILAEVTQLEQGGRAGLGGTLRLGVIPTIAPYLLPEALAALRASDISLGVDVTEGKTERILAMLSEGALDACILALPTERPGLFEAELFEDRFLLAGHAKRLADLGPVPRPEGLGESQLLLLEDGHCLTDQALAVCGRGRGHGRINTGASSLPTLSRLVEAGFGFTLMPELAAPTECAASPNLGLRRFDEPQPARRIGLVRRSSSTGAWFDDLAETLRGVGASLIANAQKVV
ncbi:hydrogen peroxide-inducible genes activator [Tropicibacter naphthalenivorans]|uniref:Morphology and auto-aggregation control protein n=1 Tax=Tropicibacter naphthalenivorans TaxID=441103 RepID=A0A0P1GNP1_9RHOB|nr:hydrogen peroxide-inducible genes activator [Tropicibacter naphthalenivorans]CUH76912.1 Morphology and auto-aggregation control protein [Tropicibacter naphthalenivorans]SMC62295.1 LysR family transcriptional regulator, hydrogen peroxide-inducible genes activator [Tropicibacter naphthalenivorans]